jgi:hypothetical protein
MSCVSPLPFLLSVGVGVLLGLIVLGLFQLRRRPPIESSGDLPGGTIVGPRDELLLGLLVLASFISGVFSTVILLAFEGR